MEKKKSTAVAKRPGDVAFPITGKYAEMMAMAQVLAVSRMVPVSYAANPEAIFAAIQYGREFGVPPMSALQNIAVINGKPSLGTDLALGLAHKHPDWQGYEIPELTNEECTVKVYRRMPTGKTATFTGSFTMDEARAAGLVRADSPWVKWRKRMLKHRATMFALRDAFPDALYGQYSMEELASDDFAEAEERLVYAEDAIHEAVLNERGVPVEVMPDEPKADPKKKAAQKIAPKATEPTKATGKAPSKIKK